MSADTFFSDVAYVALAVWLFLGVLVVVEGKLKR